MSKYYLLLSVEAVALLFQQSENFNLIDVKQCLFLKEYMIVYSMHCNMFKNVELHSVSRFG